MIQIRQRQRLPHPGAIALIVLTSSLFAITTQAETKKPCIMGDNLDWFNIGAYHLGMMADRTPNLNPVRLDLLVSNSRLAREK